MCRPWWVKGYAWTVEAMRSSGSGSLTLPIAEINSVAAENLRRRLEDVLMATCE
jgi:hypothetical protein